MIYTVNGSSTIKTLKHSCDVCSENGDGIGNSHTSINLDIVMVVIAITVIVIMVVMEVRT